MKILAIKFDKGYLITTNQKNENPTWFSTSLSNLFFDGEKAKNTFRSDWFIIKEKPKIIQKEVSQQSINKRWELKDKSLTGKFKTYWTHAEIFDEEGDIIPEFESIKGLYEFKEDKQPDILEEVSFEWEQFLEIETFNEPTGFNFKAAGKWSHQSYPDVTERDITYDILSQVLVPPVLLHNQPCELSAEKTYAIIRKYIQENINPKVAVITSDYDFCFTVKKKIPLAKPYSYQVDVNNSIFNKRKKKPKYETHWVREKEVEIFEMCPKKYEKYTPVTPFKGDSQEDLKQYIETYLKELITVINEPLCECDKCKGTGVLFTTLSTK